jgi:hypothetical protein
VSAGREPAAIFRDQAVAPKCAALLPSAQIKNIDAIRRAVPSGQAGHFLPNIIPTVFGKPGRSSAKTGGPYDLRKRYPGGGHFYEISRSGVLRRSIDQ